MDGMKRAEVNHKLAGRQSEPAGRAPFNSDLYDELRRQAERHLRRRFGRAAAGLTWQPTVLVNETLLRMIRHPRGQDSDERFYALAQTVMKRVLVDYIRHRLAQKRAGNRLRVALDSDLPEPVAPAEDSGLDIEALLNAIERLAERHPHRGDVARLRVLWGLTVEETAETLEVSRTSVERDWRFSRAWLMRELAVGDEHSADHAPACPGSW